MLCTIALLNVMAALNLFLDQNGLATTGNHFKQCLASYIEGSVTHDFTEFVLSVSFIQPLIPVNCFIRG